MKKTAANNTDVRLNNNHIVFRGIYDEKGPITKRDLSLNINLSLPTVTSCVNHLISLKLVKYSGHEKSTGGRKPQTLSLIVDSRLSLGLSISANSLRFVAINILGETIAYENNKTPFEDSDEYYKKISDMLETFLDSNHIKRELIIGLGISIPGIVNSNEIIETAPTISLRNKSVGDIKKHFKYNMFIINDADAGGFAEYWYDPKHTNLACLFVEQGIGGSVFINGIPYYGDNKRSSEFGHFCIVPHGKQCTCGKNGCLEAMCSTNRLSSDLGISLDVFFKECKNNNKKYLKILNEYLNNLAQGIVNISVIFDCTIIICGYIAQYLPAHIDQLKNIISDLSIFEDNEKRIKLCKLGARSACVGAALIWVDRFINEIC